MEEGKLKITVRTPKKITKYELVDGSLYRIEGRLRIFITDDISDVISRLKKVHEDIHGYAEVRVKEVRPVKRKRRSRK